MSNTSIWVSCSSESSTFPVACWTTADSWMSSLIESAILPTPEVVKKTIVCSSTRPYATQNLSQSKKLLVCVLLGNINVIAMIRRPFLFYCPSFKDKLNPLIKYQPFPFLNVSENYRSDYERKWRHAKLPMTLSVGRRIGTRSWCSGKCSYENVSNGDDENECDRPVINQIEPTCSPSFVQFGCIFRVSCGILLIVIVGRNRFRLNIWAANEQNASYDLYVKQTADWWLKSFKLRNTVGLFTCKKILVEMRTMETTRSLPELRDATA